MSCPERMSGMDMLVQTSSALCLTPHLILCHLLPLRLLEVCHRRHSHRADLFKTKVGGPDLVLLVFVHLVYICPRKVLRRTIEMGILIGGGEPHMYITRNVSVNDSLDSLGKGSGQVGDLLHTRTNQNMQDLLQSGCCSAVRVQVFLVFFMPLR